MTYGKAQLVQDDYLLSVRRLAQELMNDFGLYQWEFKFDSSKRRFGYCNYRRLTISLSKDLCSLNSIERIKNTILHEIAHALVGKGHGHNQVWKRQALAIGCDGQRCYDSTVIKPQHKYTATCETCEKTHTRIRRANRPLACGRCCKKFNGGRYSARFNLTFTREGL